MMSLCFTNQMVVDSLHIGKHVVFPLLFMLKVLLLLIVLKLLCTI